MLDPQRFARLTTALHENTIMFLLPRSHSKLQAMAAKDPSKLKHFAQQNQPTMVFVDLKADANPNNRPWTKADVEETAGLYKVVRSHDRLAQASWRETRFLSHTLALIYRTSTPRITRPSSC